jgi:hypothetical protein
VYRKIANHCRRVHVTNEGNIVPWLMAAKAVIHNGCTTGVEAFVIGTPAISYRASINEIYDNGFYRLPNLMSHQCFTFEEMQDMLRKILEGEMGIADGDERRRVIDHHLAGKTGPLASERMVEVLAKISEDMPDDGSVSKRTQRWLVTRGLHLAKRIKSHLPGSHNRPEFQRHRYPEVSLDALHDKLLLLQRLLAVKPKLKVEQISNVMFQIRPREDH